ncbi:FAD-dependent oxidoreductase [Candidatus Saccharibacteria bacterium]|nr:FAD-dependent oxidoreductase [Candidatus Saccharibacteria bacterium]
MKKYDVVIVGAGIAGMTAAIYAVRAGKSVLVLEEKMQGGQIINTINIENWPGDMGVTGAELSQKIYQQMLDLGAEMEYEKVLEISKSAEFNSETDASNAARACYNVRTDETEYLASAVIIATGTEPRKLSDAQAADAGKRPISYCATCDGALYKNKTVVVVGHGNSAKHEVKYLEGICAKVYNIHHDEPIPEDAEAVFVAIGRLPGTGFLKNVVDLDDNGYVVADESCHTSADGIFVAGDCRTKGFRQLVTAASDGSIAAMEAVKYLS